MDKQNRKHSVNSVLLAIVEQMKNFYEYPVVFVTKKDYSDNVFDTMCGVHKAIREQSHIQHMESIIQDFHQTWLSTVAELSAFLDAIDAVSQEQMQDAVAFTIKALEKRKKYFTRFVEAHRPNLSNDEQFRLRADLQIVTEMHEDLLQNLQSKIICYQAFTDSKEFRIKVKFEVNDLLDFVDIIYDKAAADVSKVISPVLLDTITRIFQIYARPFAKNIDSHTADEKAFLEKLFSNGISHGREMEKMNEKQKTLRGELLMMKSEDTPLKHIIVETKTYVENRLKILEKCSKTIEAQNDAATTALRNNTAFNSTPDKIFVHCLPLHERQNAVRKLCNYWTNAVEASEYFSR